MKIAQMRFVICIQGSNWLNRKVLVKRIFEGESGAKFSCKAKINRWAKRRRFLEFFKLWQKYWKYLDWRHWKGLSINLTSFVHMLNFAIIGGVVCFISQGSQPSKFAPKNGFSWEQKVALLGGKRHRKGTGRMQTWGQEEGTAPTSYGTNFIEVLGVSRPLWPKWNLPHLIMKTERNLLGWWRLPLTEQYSHQFLIMTQHKICWLIGIIGLVHWFKLFIRFNWFIWSNRFNDMDPLF